MGKEEGSKDGKRGQNSHHMGKTHLLLVGSWIDHMRDVPIPAQDTRSILSVANHIQCCQTHVAGDWIHTHSDVFQLAFLWMMKRKNKRIFMLNAERKEESPFVQLQQETQQRWQLLCNTSQNRRIAFSFFHTHHHSSATTLVLSHGCF